MFHGETSTYTNIQLNVVIFQAPAATIGGSYTTLFHSKIKCLELWHLPDDGLGFQEVNTSSWLL